MESMFNLSGSAILVDFCRVYSNRSSLPFSVILVVGQKNKAPIRKSKAYKRYRYGNVNLLAIFPLSFG